jgi:hypothetical protein
MGTFSLLGEFENGLLEKYNIFSLDGTYGSGSFQISKVNERLQNYISYNANPKKELVSLWCFDPWKLELESSSISGYALLTDQNGESFYQQAVSYMKANAAVITVDKLMEYADQVDLIRERQQDYEESKNSNDSKLSGLEDQREEKTRQLQEQAEADDSGSTVTEPPATVSNPLREIAKLRKKSTLDIVTWDKQLSGKKVRQSNFPSKNVGNKGTMTIEGDNSGIVSDLLFREYLMMYFPNYLSTEKGTALEYQIEYILGGKATDVKNLKYVVNRLLLMREGMNYLYCLQDQAISGQAGTLATALTGFLGIPALTEATRHALLLAWAYGESLIDVRVLLDGGRVPLTKSANTWSLTLENLGRITEILREGASGSETGMTYEEYLRILLNMESIKKQKMRALDMIQAELQQQDDTAKFKASNCIVAVKASAQWKTGSVFFSLPGIVMGVSADPVSFTQESSMAY